MTVKALQFSIEMGRPSANKSFYKMYKRKSNNKVVKKFEAETKGILAQSDLGWWYHQNFWKNENHFDISSSRQKIVLPEEDIQFSDCNNTSWDEEDFPETPERFINIDMKELQNKINLCLFWNVLNAKVKLLENEAVHYGLGTKLYFLCSNEECANRSEFFSTPMFADKSAFQINTPSVIGMRSIGRRRSAALKLFSLMNLGFPLSQPSRTKQTSLLVSEAEKIKEKIWPRHAMKLNKRYQKHNISFHQELWTLGLVLIAHGTMVSKQQRELLQPLLKKLIKS